MLAPQFQRLTDDFEDNILEKTTQLAMRELSNWSNSGVPSPLLAVTLAMAFIDVALLTTQSLDNEMNKHEDNPISFTDEIIANIGKRSEALKNRERTTNER